MKIVRLTVTAREGGLEAQAKLDVVVKDVNDNEPKFEVIISILVSQCQSTLLQVDEYRVDKMEVDKVKEGEELTKVSVCKIFLLICHPPKKSYIFCIYCEKLLF